MDNFVNTSSEDDSDYYEVEIEDSVLDKRKDDLKYGFQLVYMYYVKQIKIVEDLMAFYGEKNKLKFATNLQHLELKKLRACNIMTNILTILNIRDQDGIDHGLSTPLNNIVLASHIEPVQQFELDQVLFLSRYCLQHQMISCPCRPKLSF